MKLHRQHPVSIVESTAKYIGLLIFPILRAVAVLYFTGLNWLSYLHGVWMDILVVALIFGLGFVRWYRCTYSIEEDGFHLKAGIFIFTSKVIPYAEMSILSVEKTFYLIPLKAVKISLNTDGGFSATHDLKLTIRYQDLEMIKQHCSAPFLGEGIKRQYLPKNLMIILLSIITSNTIGGVIFMSTLISGAGQVFGKTVERTMVQNITMLAMFFASDVPPIAAIIAFVILGGWLVSFLMNLVRHLRFSVTRSTGLVIVESGIVTKREYLIAVNRINLIELRQSIIMKLFGFYTVMIHVNGYGKNKYELSVLMPAGEVDEITRSLRLLLPEIPVCAKETAPKKKYLSRFLIPPIWWIIGVTAAWAILYLVFPNWRMVTLFLGLMAEVPCIWYLIVKIISFFHTGIGFRQETYTFCYTYGYRIKTVSVPTARIVKVTIRRSIFQLFSGCCDVVVRTYSNGRKRHVIPNIAFEEAKAMMKVCDYYQENTKAKKH